MRVGTGLVNVAGGDACSTLRRQLGGLVLFGINPAFLPCETLFQWSCIRIMLRMSEIKRPGWDEYFMDIAHVVSRRGNCSRRQVAAVIVRDRRIISTGYNGTPRGITNCCDGGCARCASDAPSGEGLGDCVCCHAEENAIVQAAYHGISVKDGTLYCTISPCLMCTKMIINAGLSEVIYEDEYHFNDQAKALFKEAGVKCRQFNRAERG